MSAHPLGRFRARVRPFTATVLVTLVAVAVATLAAAPTGTAPPTPRRWPAGPVLSPLWTEGRRGRVADDVLAPSPSATCHGWSGCP